MLITFLNPLFHLIFRKPPYKNRTERILNTNPNKKKSKKKIHDTFKNKATDCALIIQIGTVKKKVIRLFSIQSVISIPAYKELLNSWTA